MNNEAQTFFGQIPLRIIFPVNKKEKLISKIHRFIWKCREFLCSITSHTITRQYWVNKKTRAVAEIHYGCTKCPMFWTKKQRKYE